MCTISYEKVALDLLFNRGREFGWIVVVLIAVMYWMFRGIERHYSGLRDALSMESYQQDMAPPANTVLILVPRIHRGVMQAIDYGRSISTDVRALNIEIDPASTPRLKQEWDQWAGDIPLVILHSPFRSLIGPLLAY